jgi:membrane protein YqaA with SNARE-associated domain
MFRRLYDWTISLADRPRAPVALGAVSFAESSFFPIPPDVVLVPMTLARPERAWFYAAICTVTSVLGGIVGYLIGWLLFDTIGQWLIQVYGLEGKADTFRQQFAAWGHWVILIKGFTPIPFKLVTIMSGAAHYDLLWFILLSTVTRGGRFFAVAGLLNRFAGPIRALIEKHTDLVVIVLVVTIIGGFLIARWLI